MRILSAFLLVAVLVGLAIFLTLSSSWSAIWAPQVQAEPTAIVEEMPTPTPDWIGKKVVDISQPVVLRSEPAPSAQIVGMLRHGDKVALSGCDADALWCQTEDGVWLLAYMVGELPGDLPVLGSPGLTLQEARVAPTPTEAQIATPTPEPTPTVSLMQLIPTATPTPGVVEAVVTDAANLRAGPGTEFDRVGNVAAAETIRLSGKLADASWYRLDDGSWIAAFLVEAPAADLPVIAPDAAE